MPPAIVFKHDLDGQGNGGITPESTADALRRIMGAGGTRPPFGFGAQQKAIEQWGRENGLWVPWEQATAGAREGGVEHLIRESPGQGLVVKITIPPAFGRVPCVNAGGNPALREASPLEYLARWEFSNAHFNDDVRILGATGRQPGFPSFIATQKFVDAPPPTPMELEEYLAKQGYRKVPGEWLFYNPDERAALFDARPANFAWRANVAAAFDVIASPVRGELEAAIERMLP